MLWQKMNKFVCHPPPPFISHPTKNNTQKKQSKAKQNKTTTQTQRPMTKLHSRHTRLQSTSSAAADTAVLSA
jgi:hypothetical protein